MSSFLRASTENHRKQGRVLPKTVMAEKCTKPSECKDLRRKRPSWWLLQSRGRAGTAGTPAPPRQGAPLWVLSREAQGLLLVPTPRSHIADRLLNNNNNNKKKENPLFDMFTTAAVKPLWFGVFAFVFPFLSLLLLLAQIVSLMLSSGCRVHGDNTKKKHKKA